MKLVFVRHGESLHLTNRILSGPLGCRGLTENGIVQVEKLTVRLRERGEFNPCDALLSSPVRRALQSAEILAPALPGCTIEIDPDLTELRYGEADGLTHAEYERRYGAFNPPDFPDRLFAPGGESWNDTMRRVPTVLERLEKRFAGQTVVVVTHAGFIVLALLHLFSIPFTEKRGFFDPDFTSLTEWQVKEGRWTLDRYNDRTHLTWQG